MKVFVMNGTVTRKAIDQGAGLKKNKKGKNEKVNLLSHTDLVLCLSWGPWCLTSLLV
jgi:hypothetical protein